MKNILVIADPLDCEQRAYEKALSLGKLTSARIHVVTLCHESLAMLEHSDFSVNIADVKQDLLTIREQWWQRYLDKNPPHIEVTYEAAWDKYLHHWVIEHCKERHYDIIVKTGHRSEQLFYTPSDWQLFRKAPAPIYSVNPNVYKHKKVVLVALDLIHKQEQKHRLNKQLLEQGFQLAVQSDAELHCCYSIQIPTLMKDMDLIDVPSHTKNMEKQARELCKQWLDDYDIDEQSFHVREGKPWQVINTLANKLNAQCIVIGSMGRKGVPGKLIGNTAEKIIHHARTDLLVIRPD